MAERAIATDIASMIQITEDTTHVPIQTTVEIPVFVLLNPVIFKKHLVANEILCRHVSVYRA